MLFMNTTCTTDTECEPLYCGADGFCGCLTGYFLVEGICRKCPGLGQSCAFAQCCEDVLMRCDSFHTCVCRYFAESSTTCRSQLPLYITASQIALSAALIMGIAALTMVVYRLCTKPRYLSARQRALATQNGINADSDSLTYANYLRASLSSMQIRVLSRLRDRPPAYGSSEARQAPVSLPEAPPPYEGPAEGTSLPPNYTDIVLSPLGYVNSTFVDTEGGGSLGTNSDTNRQNTDCDNDRPSDGSSEVNKVTECSIEDKAETADDNRIPT